MKNSSEIKDRLKRPLKPLAPPLRYLQHRSRALTQRVLDWTEHRQAGSIPLPPPLLRMRVHGDFDSKSYLRVGQIAVADIKRLVSSLGRRLDEFENILDFGCGSGRVLRFLSEENGIGSLHGTDIDSQAIRWCRKHIPSVEFSVNRALPPTEYQDNTFDFIYAISVFTHLDEEMQFAWLQELKRITKPGAVLALSVVDAKAFRSMEPENCEKYLKDGFVYWAWQTGKFKFDGLPDFYQAAAHSQEYIQREWSRYFRILRFVEHGINNHQNVALLVKE